MSKTHHTGDPDHVTTLFIRQGAALTSFNTTSYTAASGVLQRWSPQQRPLRSSWRRTPFKIGNRGISWTGVHINPDATPPAKSPAPLVPLHHHCQRTHTPSPLSTERIPLGLDALRAFCTRRLTTTARSSF
ncbi:hypothetical protein GALMADRAFT_144653 [Galerina marginata CBS 339.88]|uniref:Uncharacterized protein n=1 Tax=Galerina marginata (strain CBS 339.88) TaxID=685588 RepID=A0A067SU90_GALM3|nr:hypothetical protein GALMADRAFT_144653 [Galerina marginata CBS 339.88]